MDYYSELGWNPWKYSICIIASVLYLKVFVGVKVNNGISYKKATIGVKRKELYPFYVSDTCLYVVSYFETISSASVFHHLHINCHTECILLPATKSNVPINALICMSYLFGYNRTPFCKSVVCSFNVNILILFLKYVTVTWTYWLIICSQLNRMWYPQLSPPSIENIYPHYWTWHMKSI